MKNISYRKYGAVVLFVWSTLKKKCTINAKKIVRSIFLSHYLSNDYGLLQTFENFYVSTKVCTNALEKNVANFQKK